MSGPEEPTLIELAGRRTVGTKRRSKRCLAGYGARCAGTCSSGLGGTPELGNLPRTLPRRSCFASSPTWVTSRQRPTGSSARGYCHRAPPVHRSPSATFQRPDARRVPAGNPSEPGRPERPGPGERALYRALDVRAQARLPDATAHIFWLASYRAPMVGDRGGSRKQYEI